MESESIPVVNRKAALERIGGDAELLGEIIDIFLEDAPEQLAILKTAIQDEDWELAQRQVHSLKSASANVGAERFSNLAKIMELAFADGEVQNAVSKLDQLTCLLAEANEVLCSQLKER